MKKTLLLLLNLLIGLSIYSQDNLSETQEVSIMYTYSNNDYKLDNKQFNINNYKQESPIGLGFGLFLGGAVLTTAGILTQPPTIENSNKDIVNEPFLRQGPRAISIISGSLCVGIGCVISLSKL